MAAIGTSQVTVLFDKNAGQRVVGYEIRNFDTADTYAPTDKFALVEVATFIVSGASTTVGSCSVSTTDNTTITLTLANSTNATGYLLVRGQTST